MSSDPVRVLAKLILSLSALDLQRLREMLEDDGRAGVTAAIPPDLPLKEGAAEVPFEDWPAEYWESGK